MHRFLYRLGHLERVLLRVGVQYALDRMENEKMEILQFEEQDWQVVESFCCVIMSETN